MEVSYPEELTRKTLETVEALALRYDQGVLTDKQLRIALDAVWGCTSGLVDQMGEIMSDPNIIGLTPEKETVVMSNGDRVFLINRNKTTTTITDALKRTEGSLKSWFTEVEAVDHVRKLVLAFKTKGFQVC